MADRTIAQPTQVPASATRPADPPESAPPTVTASNPADGGAAGPRTLACCGGHTDGWTDEHFDWCRVLPATDGEGPVVWDPAWGTPIPAWLADTL